MLGRPLSKLTKWLLSKAAQSKKVQLFDAQSRKSTIWDFFASDSYNTKFVYGNSRVPTSCQLVHLTMACGCNILDKPGQKIGLPAMHALRRRRGASFHHSKCLVTNKTGPMTVYSIIEYLTGR